MEQLKDYIIAAGFESIESFAHIRLIKGLRLAAENNYWFAQQKKEIQEKISGLEKDKNTINAFFQELQYDFDVFLCDELKLFYQENIQQIKLQLVFFEKKYGLKTWTDLANNYQVLIQFTENEKDNDAIVWEHLHDLQIDFKERIKDLSDGV